MATAGFRSTCGASSPSTASTACSALSWARRRFYLVRTAAALGEIRGRRESGHRGQGLGLPYDGRSLGAVILASLTAVLRVAWLVRERRVAGTGCIPTLACRAVGTVVLLAKSLIRLLADRARAFARKFPRTIGATRCTRLRASAAWVFG